jgi:hypothetical protein
VVTGDFRGNGILDLAVLDQDRHTVSVFRGNGNGTFQNAVAYPVDTGTDIALAVGDVNGDGHPDIVVVGSNVSVLLNNGDGTFGHAIITQLHGTLSQLSGIALGDVNGDGHLDIVTASAGIGVLLGNGDGTFRLPYFVTDSSETPQGIVLADLRRTGHLDLATVSFFTECDPDTGDCVDIGTVSVRFGSGDGFFGPATDYSIAGAARTIAVGDFNGDGILDLVTGNGYSNLRPSSMSVLLGNGDGTFQQSLDSPLPGGPPTSLVVADFNRDGISDVAVSHFFSNTVTVFLGSRSGALSAPLTLSTDRFSQSLAAGDFNRDGFPDLASADFGAGTVSVFLNDANRGTRPGVGGQAGKGGSGARNPFSEDGLLDRAALADRLLASPGLPATSIPTDGLSVVENLPRPQAGAAGEDGSSILSRVPAFSAAERSSARGNLDLWPFFANGFADPVLPGANLPGDAGEVIW